MKKSFFLIFLLTFCFSAISQNIRTDTLLASKYNKRAQLFVKESKYDSASVYFAQASSLYKKHDIEKWLDSQNDFADALIRSHRESETKEILNDILKKSQDKFGKENRFQSKIYKNFGNIALKTYEYEKALEYFNKALTIRRKYSSENNAEIATLYNNIGLVYNYLGDNDKSLKYYQKALNIRTQLFGEKSIEVALIYNNLSVVYFYKDEYTDALDYAQKSIMIRKEILGEKHPDIAQSYNNLAALYNSIGRYPEALEYHFKTLSINRLLYGEKHANIATSYTNIASVYNNINRYDSALIYNQKAYQMRKELLGDEHIDIAYSFDGLSTTYEKIGKYDLALDYKIKAQKLFSKTLSENHPDVATSFNGLGTIYDKKGNYDKAAECYKKALKIYQNEKKESINVAMCYVNLGSLYSKQYQTDMANDYLQKAIKIYKDNSLGESSEIATAYLHLADLYMGKSEYEKALDYQQKALKIKKTLFDETSMDVAVAYQNIGKCYEFMKNYDKALEYQLKSLKIAQAIVGDEHITTATCFENLGWLYEIQKDYKKATDYFEKCLSIRKKVYGEKHPETAMVYSSLGKIYYKQDDFEKALLYFQQSIATNLKDFTPTPFEKRLFENPNLNQYFDGNSLLYSLVLKSLALVKLSETKKDKKYLEKALSTIELAQNLIVKIRRSNTRQSDKISVGSATVNINEVAVMICYLMYLDKKDVTYFEKALNFCESKKAGVLIDAIAKTKALKFNGIPDSLVLKEKNIRQEINMLEKEIAEKPDSSVESNFRNKLLELQNQYDELSTLFETKYPKYFKLKNNSNYIKVSEIQKQLDDKTCIISYLLGGADNCFIFAITKNDVDFARFDKPLDLNENIDKLRNAILKGYEQNAVDTFQNLGYKLYKTLFPFKLPSKIENLIIIPDENLNLLPFEILLQHEVKGTKKFKTYPYLIKKYGISYEYSLNLFLNNSLNTPNNPSMNDWLALAPVFDDGKTVGLTLRTRSILEKVGNTKKDKDTTKTRGVLYHGMSVSPLPATENEVNQIFNQFNTKNLKAKVQIKSTANEQFAKSGELKNYRCIHFATHGFVNTDYPELSGILLAQDSTTHEDGILYTGDIYNLELNANLVVLSACETGLGKIETGEGVMGLSRALLYAGAQNLVVSLWQVSDASTSQLMIDFYAIMLEKSVSFSKTVRFNESLQQAKLKMINEGKYAHPFFWSPFVLIGR